MRMFNRYIDEKQCELCKHFGGRESIRKNRWPCYLNCNKPIQRYCGGYSEKKSGFSMTPDNHLCPACNLICNCGATLLDGIHMTTHTTFRHLNEEERRRFLLPPTDRCVHKCPQGKGENWVPSTPYMKKRMEELNGN